MNDLFFVWLSLSLSGSFIALILRLLRPLLSRLGKTWQYYIWLLVIFRFIIPFSPDINIVGNLFQQAQMTIQYEETTPDTNLSDVPQPLIPYHVFDKNNLQKSSVISTDFDHIWGILWLLVAMVLLTRKIAGYIRCQHAINEHSKEIMDGPSPEVLNAVRTSMGIQKNIPVFVNPLIRAPMLVGIKKPMIIVPTADIPAPELMLIYRHELTHFRRKDFLYKWLVEFTVCLHWFNPVMYWVREQISKDCEFSCDEMVVSGLDDTQRRAYGETLLHSIAINHAGKTDTASLSLNKDGKLIKKRLDAIMKYHQKSKCMVLLTTVLTAILLCGTVFAGAYTGAAVGESKNVDSTVTFAQDAKNQKPEDAAFSSGIIYKNVEMRHYEGKDGHPYIHAVKTNTTTKRIIGYQYGMLAFDKDGNPLKIDWWSLDTDTQSTYFYLNETATKIAPNETDDKRGGWSLNFFGKDASVDKVAYVLYCDKQVTFEDGSVWINQDFEKWRAAYEGKKTAVSALKDYYPYKQTIPFTEIKEYPNAGISYQNGAYYYGNSRIRIFMDVRADNSFQNFVYDEKGSVDLKIQRDKNGGIVKVGYIAQEEADEILADILDNDSDLDDNDDNKDKEIEDIDRLTIADVPESIQAAFRRCENNKWYVIEGNGRQYIYYKSLPHNYAYQYEANKNTVNIFDIGKSESSYVLLSVKQGFSLTIRYNSNTVPYTKTAVSS